MAEAADAGADAGGSSPIPAQDSQSLPQPGEASSNIVFQPASDASSLVYEVFTHGVLTPEHVSVEDASSFFSALSTAHQCDCLREERETLCQQLTMRLLWGRRSAQSDSLLERLRQELPADACADAINTGLLEAVYDRLNGAIAPVGHKVGQQSCCQFWRLLLIHNP